MAVIKDTFSRFFKRLGDFVFEGKNRTMIVLGTDRKKEKTTGYGEGGKNDPESSTIDIVAYYENSDPDYANDRSRIYVSAKTDPDDYFQIERGEKIKEQPAIVLRSDNIYLSSRKTIKIQNGKSHIILKENGDIEIISDNIINLNNQNVKTTFGSDGKVALSTNNDISIKNSGGSIDLDAAGNITLNAQQGPKGRILTENDVCAGVDPVTGAFIISQFLTPPGNINNQKIKIT